MRVDADAQRARRGVVAEPNVRFPIEHSDDVVQVAMILRRHVLHHDRVGADARVAAVIAVLVALEPAQLILLLF